MSRAEVRRADVTEPAAARGLVWTVVVPLKSLSGAKSRLAPWLGQQAREELMRAMVGDVLAAAAAASRVDRIVIVTGDPAMVEVARDVLGQAPDVVLDVVEEPEPPGLNPAVHAGIDAARRLSPSNGVGVLLGDLPALRPAELDEALGAAGRLPRGVVADAAGTGTTLLTALPGVAMEPAFGPGSAALHRARGHATIPTAPASGLSHDVDVPADLAAAAAIGVGPRTRQIAFPARPPQPGPVTV